MRYLSVLFVTVAVVGCNTESPQSAAPAAQPAATPAAPSAAPAVSAEQQKADADAIDPSKLHSYGEPIHPGADFPVTMAFTRDTRTFKIAPLDGVEFNYRIEKGGTMVYSWTASDDLNWDFHGEPKGSKPGFAEGYATGEGKEG